MGRRLRSGIPSRFMPGFLTRNWPVTRFVHQGLNGIGGVCCEAVSLKLSEPLALVFFNWEQRGSI
jgi:hypothetical protein